MNDLNPQRILLAVGINSIVQGIIGWGEGEQRTLPSFHYAQNKSINGWVICVVEGETGLNQISSSQSNG